VRAAVQSAFVYPAAAAAMERRGRTQVTFKLRDTVASGARIQVTSGMGLIDRAALQSVMSASYPPAPPELAGIEHEYQIWIEFRP
jgi:TonB family protein